MSNLAIRGPCKHCDKETDLAVPDEMKEALKNIGKTRIVEQEPKAPNIEELVSKEIERRMSKKDEAPKEKIVEKFKDPRWLPQRLCANGACTANHDNEHYDEKVKKRCDNGDCVGKGTLLPAKAAFCPWCTSKDEDGKPLPMDERFEDLTEEELAKIPEPKTHTHHHEEE